MKKILFITHDTSRSGAPIVLLYFMKWLKEYHPSIKIGLVALRNGGLLDEFKEVADSFYNIPGNSLYKRIRNRIKIKSVHAEFSSSFINQIKRENFDLVYANTVSSIPLGVALKKELKGVRLISHIHELPTTIKLILPRFSDYTNFVDHFISASELVAENLKESLDVSIDRINTVYEFTEKLEAVEVEKKRKIFTVGASGTFHWRKGGDVFLQVLRNLNEHYPEHKIQFSWIGKIPESERIIAEADINKMGIQDKISFSGLVTDPKSYYNEFDVFLLSSREDPFPLVCIEVGMLGVPIICFENATGTAEVLKHGGGFMVPYLDARSMADKVVYYYENPKVRHEHGEKNRDLFSQFTPEEQCPKILEVIRNYKTPLKMVF